MSERLTPLIKIENVAKTFEHLGRNIDVLRGIDLEIGAAEMVSIVGQSGVGKSTFLHILGTLDRPSSGRVLFRGEDVFAYPEPKLAGFRNRMVGFVFQFHYLLPEFSALENVVLPTLIQRMKPAEGETRA